MAPALLHSCCYQTAYAGASRPACSMLSVLSVPPMAGIQRAANGQALSALRLLVLALALARALALALGVGDPA